jgi:hypothetical protein
MVATVNTERADDINTNAANFLRTLKNSSQRSNKPSLKPPVHAKSERVF